MNTIPATYDTHFPAQMLRDMVLLVAPEAVAEAHGYDYDRIKDLPNFKTQLAKVEAELLADGTITRAIAEIGLNKAIETIAYRIASDRISNDDLNKFANTLHKVSTRDGAKGSSGEGGAQFTLEINIGGETMTITANKAKKQVEDDADVIDGDLVNENTSKAGEIPILDEIDDDNEPIPQDILDSIGNSGFSLEIE